MMGIMMIIYYYLLFFDYDDDDDDDGFIFYQLVCVLIVNKFTFTQDEALLAVDSAGIAAV